MGQTKNLKYPSNICDGVGPALHRYSISRPSKQDDGALICASCVKANQAGVVSSIFINVRVERVAADE